MTELQKHRGNKSCLYIKKILLNHFDSKPAIFMLLGKLFAPNTVKLPPMVSWEEGTETNTIYLAGPVADMKAQETHAFGMKHNL